MVEMQLSSVVLPEPDGPMTATNSPPPRHVERDPAQGAGDVLAASVVLLHRLHAQGGDA